MLNEHFTRGHLPHWFVPGAFTFVTYRLFGTIPRAFLDELERKRDRLLKVIPRDMDPRLHRHQINKLLFADYDRYLDSNKDVDWLTKPPVAELVRGSIHFMKQKGFFVHCYTIMPNHVHILIHSVESHPSFAPESDRNPLTKLLQEHKSYTGRQGNALLGRSGPFWQDECYDHWVRNDKELENIVAYINANAVKAGLCERAVDWLWSSAAERFALDGDFSGWLDEQADLEVGPT